MIEGIRDDICSAHRLTPGLLRPVFILAERIAHREKKALLKRSDRKQVEVSNRPSR